MQVKICGINTQAAFDAACEASADWVGFVFFPRSPRHVTPAHAASLSARCAGGPLRVGLFVDPADGDLAAALAALPLDTLQLYAPPARVSEIRRKFLLPVWRAVGIASARDLPAHAEGVDALVIEPRPAPDATRPGGNATALDWAMLHGWRAPLPWLLAGGLTPSNVAAAIAASGARAVDVSTGVESAPGMKEPGLIRSFVAAARAASATA